jgi:excisionase family DNA binding protein
MAKWRRNRGNSGARPSSTPSRSSRHQNSGNTSIHCQEIINRYRYTTIWADSPRHRQSVLAKRHCLTQKRREFTMPELKRSENGLMSYKEAAEYLKIGKSTLYALVSTGQLDCVRFGVGKTKQGVTRFRHEDLESFVRKKVRRARR